MALYAIWSHLTLLRILRLKTVNNNYNISKFVSLLTAMRRPNGLLEREFTVQPLRDGGRDLGLRRVVHSAQYLIHYKIRN